MATGDKLVTLDGLKEVYDSVQEDMGDLILVQDSQPASPDNKIWIKETPQNEVQIPTYTEFTELKNALGTVPSGKTAQGQITDNASDIADLESAIDSMPTEETGQELLLQEIYNTGLTDTALTVIGMIFDNLPQDEPAVDIVHSLELECERLQAIYENWMSERSA